LKKLLYLDTTTDWIVIGVYEFSKDQLQRVILTKGSYPRESSYRLVSDIQKLFQNLSLEKVDSILCAYGPGSFTGIRIAVSTARNLSQFWNIPVQGLDTLEIYSSYYFHKTNKESLVLLDAKMKKLYAGSFSEKGFSGSFDIEPAEIHSKFSLSAEIFSDFEYPNSSKLQSDYPEPDFLMKMKLSEINNLGLSSNSFKNIIPHYIRGTYAEGKKHG
jgi:tRNA threonylcarbamoyladenosine biosynthesis protein TsaB